MSLKVEFSDNPCTIKLVRQCTADQFVIDAAKVSNLGEGVLESLPDPDLDQERFINALVKGRHGSPFEHTFFTFFVEAPLFVFREWQRHRISSFNEMSGRYTEMRPKFYLPNEDRKLINIGTKMKPNFVPGTQVQYDLVREPITETAYYSWEFYQRQLAEGIANEVARMHLPINIYSSMYWSVNARSLMNFLSLRTQSVRAGVPSYPQWEIQKGADDIEVIFQELMPWTHNAFDNNGRVAP